MTKDERAQLDEDVIGATLKDKLDDLEQFCTENGLDFIVLTNRYDRLSREESVEFRSGGSKASIAGLGYIAWDSSTDVLRLEAQAKVPQAYGDDESEDGDCA
jgi:hypothetical protein